MYRAFLLLHIAGGTAALLTGLLAAATRKGGNTHIRSGITYYWAMYATCSSAVIMALLKWNPFLLAVGIFAAYLTYMGRKTITYLRLREPYTPRLADKLPIYAALITGAAMLLYPVWQHRLGGGGPALVLPVFGGILLLFALRDARLLANPANFSPRNPAWLPRHIASMGGAYISTVTAFLVVNIRFSPGWVVWLAPSAVGSIFISIAITRLRTKTINRKPVQTAIHEN